jgi:GT2 family glycosyltransferase
MTMRAMLTDVGCVVIGRNEGDRLVRCLDSLVSRAALVVYVDSGSTDRSVAEAEARGVSVVALDMSQPFTAARGRNAGFERLIERAPALRHVQFVDGDCEVVGGWLETAHARLEDRADLAVVCGRRRERNPSASVYNLLCDLEWDTPVGEAVACGGDAMMRVEAFRAVGGFDPTLIAGEEPELCFRLRAAGWRIERIDAEMTLHDAAMFEARQWWTRNVRGGHAFTEGAYLHGASGERYNVRETLRIFAWGGALPAAAVLAALPTLGLSLGLLGAYPLKLARLYGRYRERGLDDRAALAQAVAHTLVSFPEMQGLAKFVRHRLRGTRSRLIEYK